MQKKSLLFCTFIKKILLIFLIKALFLLQRNGLEKKEIRDYLFDATFTIQ
jgi:hypothetical protein